MKVLPIANDPTGAKAEEISRAMWRICIAKEPAPEDTQFLTGWEIDEDGTAHLQMPEMDITVVDAAAVDALVAKLGARVPAGQRVSYLARLKAECNARARLTLEAMLPPAMASQLVARAAAPVAIEDKKEVGNGRK